MDILIKLKPKNKKEDKLPQEAAGRIMTTNVPAVSLDATIGQVNKDLSDKRRRFETLNYIYVVDGDRKLKGVLSVKELFLLDQETKVSKVMRTDPISVSIYANREHVALTALKYNIKAIPVVDTEDVLLGVVTSDTILDVLHSEHLEDILYSAGITSPDETIFNFEGATVKMHIKKRLPWLVVGLFGGIVAALIIRFFEQSVRAEIALVAFIPAIVYIADAVGNQTQTLFIRTLALEHNLDFKKYVAKEMRVVFLLAIFLSAGFSLAGFLWSYSPQVALIVGIAVFITIIVAAIVALFLPRALHKRNYDPAVATGPFATVLRDLTNLLIYFSIARIVFMLWA
ncbi:MAG: magnesium transporter [Candidatus Spechtbacterales bacterium]|nr:magnesium transporter [Candidatus Spechtbacterales bacterium]